MVSRGLINERRNSNESESFNDFSGCFSCRFLAGKQNSGFFGVEVDIAYPRKDFCIVAV